MQAAKNVNVASVYMTSVLFLVRFNPDYGFLLELHALTLVARSYVLLLVLLMAIHLSKNTTNKDYL